MMVFVNNFENFLEENRGNALLAIGSPHRVQNYTHFIWGDTRFPSEQGNFHSGRIFFKTENQ